MRIVHLMPGAGGTFYCENCMRDAGLLRTMRRLGHDAISVPLYLPLQLDGPEPAPPSPVFFGGINVYLQEKSALFRHTPRWVDRIFDAPALLRWAASKAGMTDAKTLAETTLSMLRGEEGRQAKELDRLVAWLATEQRPDVVCISNALLLGVARRVRQELGAAVVCQLQDEDIFLDAFPEPWREQSWALVGERARDVDAFVAVSGYYGDLMRQRLGLDADRVHRVYNGIATDGYAPAGAPPDPPAVGYLERLCPEKGFDILVEAFILLKRRAEFADLRLRAAGGWTAGDKRFLESVHRRTEEAGVADAVDALPNLDRPARQAFLRDVSVLSVPARHPEAFGMYVLEALATGVPVVLPRRGAFPELVEATGGGVLCEPEDPEALADALAELLLDADRSRELGEGGRGTVLERFTEERMAGEAVAVYEQALERRRETA
jgi:glycosyltransferase involved in cell wall biosynthesis